jgi:hypothetical protein
MPKPERESAWGQGNAMRFNRANLYLGCTVTILVGFAMLIQPLSMEVFSLGLPVMIAGIVVHIILDHIKEGLPDADVEDAEEGLRK